MARFARRESTKICLFRLFLGYLGIWVCSRQLRGLISYAVFLIAMEGGVHVTVVDVTTVDGNN